MVQIRYFAGAAEAAGLDEAEVDASELTASELRAELGRSNPRLAEVLRVSSLLADGARLDDPDAPLAGVQRVDVLPPFAGG
ncbi:MAG TPA: MoaD/ThiS family protein [Propioniciclava sp.]|jgi:molybdopterin synthase sulfur carrier subunit|uniref:MoaD/ThiS family protein n=1 Tax=Propioniciclava sp. TaxID=2038686 RepID=UPI002C44508E|nr:MoaD/ThiS family protein [Propioniciclava sp.]HRL48873.1 MoaD/ThiS family protein [Propioniciclava sp.]HRL81678.1 MoaD/ThiS family protein [Propioniciclava sp.]